MDISYDGSTIVIRLRNPLHQVTTPVKTVEAIPHFINVDVDANGFPLKIELIAPYQYVDDLEPYALPELTISVEHLAKMVALSTDTIYRILREDKNKPQDDKQLRSAHKVRGRWVIPYSTGLAFKKQSDQETKSTS